MHGGHEKRKRSKEQFVSTFVFPSFVKHANEWIEWQKKPISKLNATLQTSYQNFYIAAGEYHFDLTLSSRDIFNNI